MIFQIKETGALKLSYSITFTNVVCEVLTSEIMKMKREVGLSSTSSYYLSGSTLPMYVGR